MTTMLSLLAVQIVLAGKKKSAMSLNENGVLISGKSREG